MEVSYRDDGTITQYGAFLGAMDGHTITEIEEQEAAKLSEPGTKILNADGTITVTPPGPDLVAQAAAAALAQHKAATVADMVAAFRPLAANPAMQGATAYMLKMALGVASGMGVDVQPGDLPADLQTALAALPSGT